jgi:hypothetical protein
MIEDYGVSITVTKHEVVEKKNWILFWNFLLLMFDWRDRIRTLSLVVRSSGQPGKENVRETDVITNSWDNGDDSFDFLIAPFSNSVSPSKMAQTRGGTKENSNHHISMIIITIGLPSLEATLH